MKKKKKDKYSFINSKACTKLLLFICIFLIGCILCKDNINYKNKIYDKVFNDSFSFVGVKNFYNKFLGGIIPLDNIIKEENTKMVFNEEINFSSFSKFLEGIKIEVSDNYLVPIIESGMVIFVGEKEGYGNTIIIEGINGIDIWYSDVNNSNVKLYDYVEKGNYLGEVNKELYLVFCKNGKYISYEDYIKEIN